MGSLFDSIHRTRLQPAIDAVVSDTVIVTPLVASQYKAAEPDPERAEVTTRAKISLIEGTTKIDGQRRGGELAGHTNISRMAAELWMSAEAYEAVGYTIKTHDRITKNNGEVFEVLYPHVGPHGDFFCKLTAEAPR